MEEKAYFRNSCALFLVQWKKSEKHFLYSWIGISWFMSRFPDTAHVWSLIHTRIRDKTETGRGLDDMLGFH